MKKGAIFSKDRKHRLGLWRIWDKPQGLVLYIGLNPSTADGTTNDRTIDKLIYFTKKYGYGGFYICNLFSVISTDSDQLKFIKVLNHKKSNSYIEKFARKCHQVCLMYGRKGLNHSRVKEIDGLLLNIHDEVVCFGINNDLTPKHPLYLPNTTTFQHY